MGMLMYRYCIISAAGNQFHGGAAQGGGQRHGDCPPDAANQQHHLQALGDAPALSRAEILAGIGGHGRAQRRTGGIDQFRQAAGSRLRGDAGVAQAIDAALENHAAMRQIKKNRRRRTRV